MIESIKKETGEKKPGEKKNLAASYRNKFISAKKGNLESATTVELSGDDIKNQAETSREELYRIIDAFLDGRQELKEIADKISIEGKDAMKAVAENDDNYLLKNPRKTSMLEVIVRTDGSRPSFMIRDGKADKTTSPVGGWNDYLTLNESLLSQAIAATGRIDQDGIHIGTGFLLQHNLIVTNRHVLQAIANKENDGTWQLLPSVTIDFGYEFRARKTLNKRTITKVVFAGAKYIDPDRMDHSKLDLALLELGPTDIEVQPPLVFNIAPEWAETGNIVFTIGYPGNPGLEGLNVYSTLLEQLFKSTFGYKRLAPGETLSPFSGLSNQSMAHDATTLGGNSGSVVVMTGKAYAAAGLHFGGTLRAPRENWAHVLANCLNISGEKPGKTLKNCLDEYNVKFIDIFNG